jgi:hypothetical protein
MKSIILIVIIALSFSYCKSEYCKTNDALEIKYVKRYTYGFHKRDSITGDNRLCCRTENFTLNNYCKANIDDTLYLKSITGLLDSATLLLVDTIKELKASYGIPVFYHKKTHCTETSKWDEGEDLFQKCDGDGLGFLCHVNYVGDTLVFDYHTIPNGREVAVKRFLKKEGKYIECFRQ